MKKQKTKDAFFFGVVRDCVIAEGMWEVTPETVEKIWTVLGLVPPEADRIVDVKDRISFVCEVNGYAVWLHTKFNRKTKKNSPYGCVSIVISKLANGGQDRILYRSFYTRKTGTWVKKVQDYLSFILDQMKNHWPVTAGGNWAHLKEFEYDTFWWIDAEGTRIDDFFSEEKTAPYGAVLKGERRRYTYHTFWREKLGIKEHRRNIRKQYKRKK